MQTEDNYNEKLKILIVEDHCDIAYIYKTYFSGIAEELQIKIEIDHADDGNKALSLFSKKGPYDFVLLDIGLPDIHGIDICKAFRKSDQFVTIIINSGFGEIVEKECREAGCNYYLTKPFTKEELQSAFEDAVLKRNCNMRGSEEC